MKALIILLLLLSSVTVDAAVYSYRDEHGRLFLTDRPPNDNYRIVVTSRKNSESPSAPVRGVSSSVNEPQNIMLPNDGAFAKYINDAAQKFNIDPYLIKSIIQVESSFNPSAQSSKGAQGLMQLMPATAREVGCNDSFDPLQNIMGGTRYLSMMLSRFGEDLDLALAAYNAGPGNVERHNGIPPFRETQNYVRRVNHYYQEYLASNSKKPSEMTVRADRQISVVQSDLSQRLVQAYDYFKNRDFDSAVKAYRTILNIYPKNTQALYNLACLLDIQRYYDEAVDTYRAALREDPFLDSALYNLAVIYERLGYHQLAVDTWQDFIRVTQDEHKIRLAERYIRELRDFAALN